MHFVLTCNDQAYLDADKCMAYLEGGVTSAAVALEVEGGKIITCAYEIAKFRSQQYCTCYHSTA